MVLGRRFVNAEDEIDNEDPIDIAAEEAEVAEEEVAKTDDDDVDDVKLSASPDAETVLLFTKPAGSALGKKIFELFSRFKQLIKQI